ncbi:interferon regulatory factor 8-like [Notechis scutatus]|uniref:Interferon regulatory factor 8-like n=1 Tax=Notechis scutatus TaxID=8663 RepID=A0A6J1VTP2_9SAUR|nr:interferon regulatory factor 8-like [Notechis scutatus]
MGRTGGRTGGGWAPADSSRSAAFCLCVLNIGRQEEEKEKEKERKEEEERGQMATSKRGIRSTRKLRDWTVEQVESGKFQGLVWDDPPAKTMFRIPWKHAGKQEFRQEEDAGFFKVPSLMRAGCGAFWPADQPPSLLVPQAETPAPEVVASHLSNGFNLPNCQNREVSPQAAEPAPEMNEIITVSLMTSPSPVMGAATRPTEDFSLCVSISYAGEPPCRYLLPEGEYLFTSDAESLNGPNCLKRFVLTAPVTMADELKQEIVQRLLKDLVKGIMVASNHGGIFIFCRDKVCVSWSGFLAPEGQIKLENNTHQQLFKSQEFRSALELYQEGLGPLPDPRVILYVGDELDENGGRGCKPIIIQMEQTFAIRMRSSGGFP